MSFNVPTARREVPRKYLYFQLVQYTGRVGHENILAFSSLEDNIFLFDS
jgi:hypothetical protein